MMTRADLEGLEPGDVVLAELRFVRLGAGVAWFELARGMQVEVMGWHWDCLSLPEMPKYDPRRLLREGDRVELMERDGRRYADYDQTSKLREGVVYTVLEDEKDGIEGSCPDIRIADEDGEYEVLFCFLKLVTPVEELEPYTVGQNGMKDGWLVKGKEGLVALYDSTRHPHAKEAAKAECARLNAEFRGRVGTEVPCSEDGKKGL